MPKTKTVKPRNKTTKKQPKSEGSSRVTTSKPESTFLLSLGALTFEAKAHTKSEARAKFKKASGLAKLPKGLTITKAE